MKTSKLIIVLFLFAFTATAHAQQTPITNKHQKKHLKKMSKDAKKEAIAHRKAYHQKRLKRKASFNRKAAKPKPVAVKRTKSHVFKRNAKVRQKIYRQKVRKSRRDYHPVKSK